MMTTTTTDVGGGRSVVRSFYIVLSIAMIVIVAGGFGPSLVDTRARHLPVTPLVVLHGLAYGAWLALFLAQATLGATRRTSMHRRLGKAVVVLAPIMVALGYMTSVAMARRGIDLSGDLHIESDPLLGIVNPLGDLLAFTILVAAGFYYRRRPAVHKRLMVLATVCLMPAPLAHLIGHFSALNAMPPPIILLPLGALLFSSAVYDRVSFGRVHPVSLWVAFAVLAWDMLLNLVIGPSAAWHRFAAWIAR